MSTKKKFIIFLIFVVIYLCSDGYFFPLTWDRGIVFTLVQLVLKLIHGFAFGLAASAIQFTDMFKSIRSLRKCEYPCKKQN